MEQGGAGQAGEEGWLGPPWTWRCCKRQLPRQQQLWSRGVAGSEAGLGWGPPSKLATLRGQAVALSHLESIWNQLTTLRGQQLH